MTPQEFDGRIAVVTGASSGIGRAAAEELASRGALVAVFARSEDKLKELAAKHQGRMAVVVGDISDPAAVERLFQETESRFGDCDILVNDAGTWIDAPVDRMTDDEWDRVFAVNVRGVFLATRRALKSMMARRSGAIVNVASISGVPGPQKFAGTSAYCASKAALISFTEVASVESRKYGVRINCVSPGSVDTPMWAEVSGGEPAEMTPEEVAEVILFLASDRSRPINGQNLHVYSA